MGASCYKSKREEVKVETSPKAGGEAYNNAIFESLYNNNKRDKSRIVDGPASALYSWDEDPIPGVYNTFPGKDKKSNKPVAVTVLDFTTKMTPHQIDALFAIASFKPGSPQIVPSLHRAFFHEKQLTLVCETDGGCAGFAAIAEFGDDPYTEADAICGVIFSVATAMKDLHKQGLVQGDIQSLLLKGTKGGHDGTLAAQVPTYNLCRLAVPKRPVHHKGACAPEILLDNKQPTAQTDAWNLGVLLHVMLVGYPPLQEDEGEAKKQMEELNLPGAKFPFAEHYWRVVSLDARDLVEDLLKTDPAKRMTVSQVLEAPWIEGRVAGSADLEETRRKFADSLQ